MPAVAVAGTVRWIRHTEIDTGFGSQQVPCQTIIMVSLRARLLQFVLKICLRSVWKKGAAVDVVRRRAAALDRLFPRPPAGTVVALVNAGGVPCRWASAPGVSPERTLLYFHGGGFSIESPRLHTNFATAIGRGVNARALLVDYRLAPEYPFPAGPDDCLQAYRWLLNQPGVCPSRIVIAGDSAGANLTLVTLLQIKEAGLPMPAAAWALSPGVDCDWSHTNFEELQKLDPMFTRQALDIMTPYFGDADRSDSRISPINGDLRGLPPMLLEAGEKEMLRDHPPRFAERAQAAGVEVVCRVWQGMPHVFQSFGFLPEAKLARQQACDFLNEHMA